MPNLNAAMACAQLEQLDNYVSKKRELAQQYNLFFNKSNIKFVGEIEGSKANFWLNCVLLKDKNERNEFLTYTNNNGVMTRPVWVLMNKLEMFKDSMTGNLDNSEWIEDRLVNIPSSVRF
jgi:dTDP-4-amino-4,6-dideoxygalactose transaminase